MVDSFSVVQIIMNISGNDEGAIPQTVLLPDMWRIGGTISSITRATSLFVSSFFSPMCIWQTRGAMTAQPFVLSKFLASRTLP